MKKIALLVVLTVLITGFASTAKLVAHEEYPDFSFTQVAL